MTQQLTSTQAAELLHVHPETLRRWKKDELLTVERTPGGHRHYREAEVRQLALIIQTPAGDSGMVRQRSSLP